MMVSSEGIDSLVLPYYPTFAVFACRKCKTRMARSEGHFVGRNVF